MNTTNEMMIKIESVSKVFHSSKRDVIALNEVSLEIEMGSFTLIKGSSGCGKSTLLFALGGMLRPSSGKVIVDDYEVYAKSESELLRYRREKIGFVYQSYHLIPYLNVRENILLSQRLNDRNIDSSKLEAMVSDFKLQDRLQHKPSELSEGEKQRVALLRALMMEPSLLIADEPTGNLDPENSTIIMNHFKRFQENGGTVVMASHGTEADALADRIIYMERGKVITP